MWLFASCGFGCRYKICIRRYYERKKLASTQSVHASKKEEGNTSAERELLLLGEKMDNISNESVND